MMQRLALPALMLVMAWAEAFAQAPDRPSRINPEDSTEAVRQLRLVDAYVDQGSLIEAVDLMQSMIESYPYQVLAVPGEQPARYVSIRSYCHARLAQMPADALVAYRDRVDSQAKAILAEHLQSGEPALLHRVVDEFFCSSSGDLAAEKIGDQAFSAGHLDTALAWWSRLLPQDNASGPVPYPDPKNDRARLWAKWSIAHLMRGDLASAELGRRRLKEEHPDASGELAGRSGPYWKIVQEVGNDTDSRAPAQPRPDWLTFGGDFSHAKTATAPSRIGTVQHRWTLPGPPEVDEPDINFDSDPRIIPFQQFPRPVVRDSLFCHPVTVGNQVFASDGAHLFWFDVSKPEPVYKSPLNINNASGFKRPLRSHQTLTVAGPFLFVRTGTLAASAMAAPFPGRSGTSTSLLFCFDHSAKRLLWWVNATDVGAGAQCVFEAAPVVVGERVYIGVTRMDAMNTAHVVCLDSESGRVVWKRLIGEATNDLDNPVHPDQNILTLGEETLYYCTNMGAVAAIDLPTAKVKWLAEYNVDLPIGAKATSPQINPCVYHRGKVFAAPAGTASLIGFDAETGRTLWRSRVPAEHLLGVAKGRLIATGDRVYGIDPDTGAIAWQFPENQPKGVGRGMLAGDYVYWPTTSEIHILDQETGRRADTAVALLEGLRAKPGNLVPGNGFVLLAQNRQLLVLRPYSWLRDEREKWVAEHPQSAPGHLLLADALANDGDRGDAIHHYREALRFADPQAQIEGRALVDVAKDRLFETLLAHADDPSFAALNSTKDVDALFDEAARQAPSADARWQACARRFDALERRQDSEKARTILRRTLDDEDLARELVELSPGYRRPMGDALSRRADSWLRSATDNDAAEFASAWAAGAAVDDWIRIARRFPLESTRPTFILRQAELLASRQQPLDAFRLLADFLASQPGADDEIKAYRLILSLAPSLGNEADLAFAERRLARRDGWSHRPTLRSSTALSDRLAWTTEPDRHAVIIPAGDLPRGLPASVLVACEGTLRLCRSDTGASLWSSPANAAPESAVATMAGVLTPDANAITCRSWEDGKPLWQVKLLPQSPRDWQGLASTIGDGPRDGETTVSMTPVPATPLATRLGMVYAVTDDGWLTAIDLFQGKIRWQTHPVLAWGKRDPGDAGLAFTRLQILDGILIYQTTSRAFGVDSAGQLAWSIETLQGVADQNVVTVEDGVVLLVGRSEIACLAETTGEVRWRRKFSWPTWHAPQLLVDGDKLLALIDQYQLCRLDARTGTTLWECSAQTSPGASNRPPVVRAGQFLIESRHGLDCRSTEDGRLLWRLPTEPMLALATRGAGVESLVGGPSGLQWMCLDADTGKVRAQTPIPAIGDVVDVQWNDRTVLVRGESRTVGIDRTTTATPTRSSE